MNKFYNNILKFINNKEAKTITSNFLWLSVLQVASYIFPLITMPYLAKTIGTEGFGKIAFASAIIVWIQTIADWGFNLTATRDVAQNRENKNKVSEIFSNVLWARCFLMFVSLLFLLVLIFLIPSFRKDIDIILVTFLLIPGHILFPDWFFQAMEKMKYLTILNVTIKFIFTLLVFIFIREAEDYILQPLLTSMGYIISGIISFYIIIQQWKVKIIKPQIRMIIKCIKDSTDVFINNILPNLYNSFSTILLGVFSGSVAVGIFDAGNKFIRIGINIIHSIERAFFPFLARKIEKHNILLIINVCVSFFIGFLLFVFAPVLVKTFLSSEFENSISVIRILSVSLFFYAIETTYGKNYLLLKHLDKILRKISFKCSFIGFIISWPLVYFLKADGAALTITISVGLFAFFNYRESVKNQIK